MKSWHHEYEKVLGEGAKIADAVTKASGTWTFILAHMLWWGYWFLFQSFDAFPYGLLTMVLSLEAILLATLVLMSQNRAALRDKIAAQEKAKIDAEAEAHREQLAEDSAKMLDQNTKLTEKVAKLTEEIHAHIAKAEKTKPRTRTKPK